MKRRVAVRTPGRQPLSRKAIEIVGLVEALSGDLGAKNGLHLGSGIARLLADVYRRRRGAVPSWVRQLVAHYRAQRRES